jgi:Uma2 family endonuclease
MATTTDLLTAEEFSKLPDSGRPAELVRGVVVALDLPGCRHGEVCGRIAYLLVDLLKTRRVGRAVINNSGIVTKRDPDTVRGPDVAYYSFARLPHGSSPKGYPSVTPEVVFEVRSPSDSWPELLAKAAEYLKAGVLTAVVLDPDSQTVHIYRPSATPNLVTADDVLALPEIDEEFRIPAARFFESS